MYQQGWYVTHPTPDRPGECDGAENASLEEEQSSPPYEPLQIAGDCDRADNAPHGEKRPSISYSSLALITTSIPTLVQEEGFGRGIRVKLPHGDGRTIAFPPQPTAPKADAPDCVQPMVLSLLLACCLMTCLLLICLLLIWLALGRVYELTRKC
jgi:hypothetical protein